MKLPESRAHGKIVIPTPEEVKKMVLAGTHFHFNQRLNERYGLDISLEEYIELCRYPIKTIHKQTHKLFGIIKIRNIEVFVVRERHRSRKLLTALPYKNLNNDKYRKWPTKK